MNPMDSQAYQLALNAAVDTGAAAVATGTIEIEAPREAVWDALAHVHNWPSIRADISEVEASGPPEPGAVFTWHAGGIPVTSAFALVERATRLSWATTAPGMQMAGVYEFDELGPGRTRIRCRESIDAPSVAPQLDSEVLTEQIRTWLEGIRGFVGTRVAEPNY